MRVISLFIFLLLNISNLQATRPTDVKDKPPHARINWMLIEPLFSEAVEKLKLTAKPKKFLEYLQEKYPKNDIIQRLNVRQIGSHLQILRNKEQTTDPSNQCRKGTSSIPMTQNFKLSELVFKPMNFVAPKNSGNESDEQDVKNKTDLKDNDIEKIPEVETLFKYSDEPLPDLFNI